MKSVLFILINIDEKNTKLVDIYKQKMAEYFERAEYLKKTVLNKGTTDPILQPGGSGQAAKKKYEF